MCDCRASPSDAAAAQGPGPELHPALKPADHFALRRSASTARSSRSSSVSCSYTARPPSEESTDLPSLKMPAPGASPLWLSLAALRSRGCPGAGARRTGPRPGPRRRRRPRAGSRCARTALRAGCGRCPRSSAPRRRPGTRFFSRSAVARAAAMRSMISSVTAWMRGGHVHVALGRAVPPASRGGPPKSRSNCSAGHREALAVVEVVHVHAERAVGLEVDQLLAGSGPRTSARRRGPGP